MPKYNFENLIKISVPLIILLGIVQLTSYYYQFNVPIIEYLDLSEISTLFLNDLTTYLFFIIPIFFLIDINNSTLVPSKIILTIISFVLLIVINIINEELYFDSLYYFSFFSLILFFIPILALIDIKRIKILRRIEITSTVLWIFSTYFFFVILFIISINGAANAKEVKNNYVFFGTEITIDTTIIKSDSSFYYIGKTRNYIFFYDAKTKTPIIYPGVRVSKIVLRGKKTYHENLPPPPTQLPPH